MTENQRQTERIDLELALDYSDTRTETTPRAISADAGIVALQGLSWSEKLRARRLKKDLADFRDKDPY